MKQLSALNYFLFQKKKKKKKELFFYVRTPVPSFDTM